MNLSLRPGIREVAGAREGLAGHARRRPAQVFELEQARDVAGQQVDLEVERVADARSPRVVTARVCGMRPTAKPASSTR
jgi:hypothetical protein